MAAIVSEPVSAEEAQARQAQLHRKFGQVTREEFSGQGMAAGGSCLSASRTYLWLHAASFSATTSALWP